MRSYSHLSKDEGDQIGVCEPRDGPWGPLPGRSVGRKPRSPRELQSLEANRNPPRHVGVKATEIVDIARMLQGDTSNPLRRNGPSQSLFRAVAVYATKSLLTQCDRVADVG
jgi:hypothetical protein